jgi:hypothetical protein
MIVFYSHVFCKTSNHFNTRTCTASAWANILPSRNIRVIPLINCSYYSRTYAVFKCHTHANTDSSLTVSVTHKQKYEKNNPPYIVDCNQPQQRYQKIKDFHQPLFHGYKQCLPMCTTGNTVTSQLSITHWNGNIRKVQLTNAIACSYPTYSVSNENNSHGELNFIQIHFIFCRYFLKLI